MEPLLQLPHTFAKYFDATYSGTDTFGGLEAQIRTRKAALGFLTLIELIERDHVTVDIEEMESDPPGEFYIHSLPGEVKAAFTHFTLMKYWREYDDVDDLYHVGQIVSMMPSRASDSEVSLARLKDSMKGGADEFTCIFMLEEMFPKEGLPDSNSMEETVWKHLDPEKQKMIDQMRIMMSLEFE
jgi:hypothetical protein